MGQGQAPAQDLVPVQAQAQPQSTRFLGYTRLERVGFLL